MDGDMVCMHLSVSLFQHMSISIMKVMVMRVHPRNQMCDCVAAGFSFFWLRVRTDCMGAWERFRDSAGGCGGIAQNVWERICRAGRFAIQRGVCTERVGTYAYRGAFPHFAGRVARNVSERIVFMYFLCFSRQGCTERVGTYVYGGAFPHLNRRVARNVWERIIF